MMRALLPTLFFFFLAQPFWESKPPEKWTDREIDMIRTNSPWAQTVGPAPNVLVYLATAAPIEEAEGEARLRTKDPLPEPDVDYLDYLRESRDRRVVLAIPYGIAADALQKATEEHRMEEESVMIVGGRTYKLVGHFPPSPTDPVLRLVFPRQVQPTDRNVVFRLYLPGVEFPDREAQFRVKELLFHGKLEM
jgi:hypothetical protein